MKNGNYAALLGTEIAYILFAMCWVTGVWKNSLWIGIVITALWTIVLFGTFPLIYLRFPFVWFTAGTNILGVLLIEQNHLFLPELNRYGYSNNSLFYLVVAWFLLLASAIILEIIFPMPKNLTTNKENTIFLRLYNYRIPLCSMIIMLFALFFFIQFVNVFSHPFFLEHLDRFLYAKKYISLWNAKLIGYFTYVIPIVVAGTFYSSYRKMSFGALALFCLYKFWIGEKFGLFFLIFCYASIIVSYLKQNINLKSTIRYIFKAFLVIMVFIGVIFGHRVLLYHANITENQNYLIRRIAQDGQLWWAMYDISNSTNLSLDELNDEINPFFILSNDTKTTYNFGIYKIMKKTTPIDLFWNKLSDNSRYADSTFASIYYYFKEPGLIFFAILFGFLLWGLTRYFIVSYLNFYIPELVLSGKLMIIMNTVLTQSDFYMVFSYQTMACILIMLCLGIYRAYVSKNNI